MCTLNLISFLLPIAAAMIFAHGIYVRYATGGFFPQIKWSIILTILSLILKLILCLGFGKCGGLVAADASFFGKLAGGTFSIMGNFGLAMLIGGAYLFFRKSKARILFVPGLLLVFAWGGFKVVQQGTEAFTGWMNCHRTSCGVSQSSCGAAASSCPMSGAGAVGAEAYELELLVELGADDEISEIETVLEKHGANWEKAFKHVDLTEDEDLAQYFIVGVAESKARALLNELRADKENVDSAEPNQTFSLFLPTKARRDATQPAFRTNDPHVGKQWYLKNTKAEAVLPLLKTLSPKKKAKLAIVDTGVDGAHEDIQDVFSSSPGNTDKHGHGSHCAGIAGAVANNNLGVASLNYEGKFIDVTGYKALSDNGSGSLATIVRAITQAAEDGADVISMSLGGYSPTPPKVAVDAIEYARKLGAIVVVAAGNSSEDAKDYMPANIPGVIVVAATDQDDRKAEFSNTNTSLNMPVAAPGVNIYSLKPGNQYVAYNGTSMATPYVAGIVAVMRSLQPDLKAEDAWRVLYETGIDAPDAAKTGKLVSAEAVLQTAKSL